MKTEASVDIIFKGQAHGSVAQRLLANGFDVNVLRPWMENGRPYLNVKGRSEPQFAVNATLRKDEWKHLDETVVQIALQRLVGVNDLVSRGLVYNVPNGLGTTVLEYEDVSDMEDAQVNMDGVSRGPSNRLEFDLNYLPLPIVHADFQINARVLEASRRLGTPLDSAQAAVAARKVAEKVESILFTGASTYTFGGGTIYGYMDFPFRNTGSLTNNWDDSAGDGASILANVIAMKQASIADRHFGPWGLYMPTNFETAVDDDFKAASDKTIRQRILEIDGIEFVKAADFLTSDNVVLVELRPETARAVIGLQPTTVEWSAEGGMIFLFKVMAIIVPQLRADQDDRCGIQHWS